MRLQPAQHISCALVLMVMMLAPELLARRIWDIILNDFTTHSFGRVLISRNLTALLDAENITVYLPSSDAFFKYESQLTEPVNWITFLTYTTQIGRHILASLPKHGKMTSRLGSDKYLYVNTFYIDKRQITTINGAAIVRADIVADNGVIHVLDSIIFPVSSGLTIAQYIEKPEDHSLSFRAIVMAEVVAQSLKVKTNSSQTLMTSFSPNDSYLMNMPDYGKTPLFENITLLRQVYEAHIIENEALFFPTRCMIFHQERPLYVVSNRVHARVVKPNIATANGVIHVIDNLLLYVYHNAVQITSEDNVNSTRIFNKCIKKLREDQVNNLATVTLTMFVPSDLAFSRSPLFWQRPFYTPDHYTR
ncbi:unnamed protein product, partial [Candidula unifasciata]